MDFFLGLSSPPSCDDVEDVAATALACDGEDDDIFSLFIDSSMNFSNVSGSLDAACRLSQYDESFFQGSSSSGDCRFDAYNGDLLNLMVFITSLTQIKSGLETVAAVVGDR